MKRPRGDEYMGLTVLQQCGTLVAQIATEDKQNGSPTGKCPECA
jgi:hypothetical protein